LDEKYLVEVAKEIRASYIKGNSVPVILGQMKKQKAAWRDQSQLPLRNFFTFIALIIFSLRFFSTVKLKGIISRKNHAAN
jgi:hypothetical protein